LNEFGLPKAYMDVSARNLFIVFCSIGGAIDTLLLTE
jgi:hypothetical protein